VTVWPLTAESETVKPRLVVPALPSATATSSMESVGTASSFVMVPVPCPSRIVALVGRLRLTKRVSFG
jgi:hypothetical protein